MSDKSLSVMHSIFGIINYLITFIVIFSKIVYLEQDYGKRIISALVGILIINMVSSTFFASEWTESFLQRLIKYFAALYILFQILLFMLTKNQWTEQFVIVMVINIIGYIAFTWSYLNRLTLKNCYKGAALETIALLLLTFITILNMQVHAAPLTIISSLSIFCIIPNVIEQFYISKKRRKTNELYKKANSDGTVL